MSIPDASGGINPAERDDTPVEPVVRAGDGDVPVEPVVLAGDGDVAVGPSGDLPPAGVLVLQPEDTEVTSSEPFPTPTVAEPVAVLQFGDQQIPVDIVSLSDPGWLTETRRRCTVATNTIIATIRDLLGLPDEARWFMLTLLASLMGGCRVRLGDAATEYRDVFEATLVAMVGADAGDRCERGRCAAVEAGGLIYGSCPEVAANRIVDRLKELRIRGFTLKRILGDIRSAAGLQDRSESDAVLVSEIFPDAPVPESLIIPPGWIVSAASITRPPTPGMVNNTISAPVFITERLLDVADGTESLALAWQRGTEWRRRTVSRGLISDRRRIIELAECGAPVNSNNANEMVQYLADFEHFNLQSIPRARVTKQMGWQPGLTSFLWGSNCISSDTENECEGDNTENTITFQGADVGDTQLAAAFHSAGTMQGWQAAIAPLAAFPRLQLAIFASLAPATLAITGASNFLFELCGPTSTGKSAGLRVGASIWGNPGRQQPSLVSAWSGSRAWFERAASVANGLPLFLDDTKQAGDKEQIAQAVYDLANGRGKGRGSVRGIQRTETWQTVVFSTGEEPITSFTADAGTRARALALWGPPFGRTDPEIGQLVVRLGQEVEQNYGHAGPAFVRFLLQNRDNWSAGQAQHRELQTQYAARAGSHPVGTRIAAHLATLTLTARLAHAAGLIPWAFTDPIDAVWDTLLGEASGADQAAEALTRVVEWAVAHSDRFYSQSGHKDQPTEGWAGRWDCDRGSMPWDYLAFMPRVLTQILQEAGHQFEAIVRAWHDRGWLRVTGAGEKRVYQTRLGSLRERVWVVALTRAAVEHAVGCPGDGGAEPSWDPAAMAAGFGRMGAISEPNQERATRRAMPAHVVPCEPETGGAVTPV